MHLITVTKEPVSSYSFLTSIPSDEQAFESYEAGYVRLSFLYDMPTSNALSHLLAMVLDSDRENPLFRSPVGKNPKHILDIGTGKGDWAMYVGKPLIRNLQD
jgi:hypothetical protein